MSSNLTPSASYIQVSQTHPEPSLGPRGYQNPALANATASSLSALRAETESASPPRKRQPAKKMFFAVECLSSVMVEQYRALRHRTLEAYMASILLAAGMALAFCVAALVVIKRENAAT